MPSAPAAGASLCPTCSAAYREAADALEQANSLLLAALEATADGILVVDLEGRAVAHNTRFREMWGIPSRAIVRGDDEELRRYVADRLVDPEAFDARVAALYADPEATGDDTIRLRDGRVFERFSHPQRLEGKVVGRVWSFRDATARVTAEEELRSRERQLAASEEALRAANEALEARVAERTAELAETNLALEEEVAERARAEEELLRTASELETVFQAMPDGYFRLDADGTVLDHRPGVLDPALPPRDCIVGSSIDALCPPDVARQIHEALATVRRTRELVCVEYALPLEQGSRELEARLVPLGEDQAIAIVRDVTESRQSARELARSEEQFRTLIENGSDLIIVVDAEGKTSYLSPSAERILGWAPEERLGRSSFEMIHPEDVPEAAGRRQEAIDNPGRAVSVDFRYRHKDGGWRTFEALIRTLLPDSGAGGLVVNARDVTGRKAIEAELQRSEEYHRALIENATDLITILEPDGTIRYESAAITRLFGYGQEELLGRSAFDLIHPEDLPGVLSAFGELVAAPGVSRSVQFRFLAADGGWRFLESVGQTVNPATAEAGVVVNSRDISERRAAQEALERAMAQAEEANRAKSEFLSRMSHELRTPMNSILGFAQLLAKRTENEEQSRSIEHILRAGRHLLTLINEVLDIARIEANRHHLSLEPVRVDAAVVETVNLIRPLAAQHGCRVDDPGELPDGFVMADRQRLAQVLLNLLSNAVKYNRPGGRVWVTVEPDAEAGASLPAWRIGVHDTGPGIPAERMEELFVPFSRLGADASEVEGTGLGLALSRRLVEAMGGRLEVRSTVGVGSTFTVWLAGAESPLDRSGVRDAGASTHRTPESARPATLLYIEDNLANLTLVETILAGRPEITLVPALQGRLGVDLACQHHPDLILLDLHLPDIPGDEVLARLRDVPSTRDIPVVVISADATPRRIERLRGEGVFAYLTKPIDVDEFLDTVDAVLDARVA